MINFTRIRKTWRPWIALEIPPDRLFHEFLSGFHKDFSPVSHVEFLRWLSGIFFSKFLTKFFLIFHQGFPPYSILDLSWDPSKDHTFTYPPGILSSIFSRMPNNILLGIFFVFPCESSWMICLRITLCFFFRDSFRNSLRDFMWGFSPRFFSSIFLPWIFYSNSSRNPLQILSKILSGTFSRNSSRIPLKNFSGNQVYFQRFSIFLYGFFSGFVKRIIPKS